MEEVDVPPEPIVDVEAVLKRDSELSGCFADDGPDNEPRVEGRSTGQDHLRAITVRAISASH